MKRINRLVPIASLALAVAACNEAAVAPDMRGTPDAVTAFDQAGAERMYVVLYSDTVVPPDAAATVQQAGGTVVYSYDAIGVVLARSSSESFAETMSADDDVEGASATAGFATRVTDEMDLAPLPDATPAPGNDPFSDQQWDMIQIHAPEARAINGGSPSVVVGILDTGIDFTHPDLSANIHFAKSASCVSGVPDPNPAAWMDVNGHGTHTAGTVAAARNGIGIVGVAPNVQLAAVKTGNDNGYFFPEAVICAFMWAAEQRINVTSNSYFADPWLFNCRNDPGQRAIWKAEQRAIRYAMQRGVTVVAAAGNENLDLSKRNTDDVSPSTGPSVPREVTNACVVIPVEIPGVIGVSANGNLMQKSYYSSYGVGVIDVVAPGGDSRFQRTAAAPRGTVLSTYPGNRYAFLQGTSMAGPHVAGVAALAISARGRLAPSAVQAILTRTADPLACPTNPFDPGPPFNFTATCLGGKANNGFYGAGQVNALRAVTR